jgi:hypothetical protein
MLWTTVRGALLFGAAGLCTWACASADHAPPYIDPKEFVIGGAAGQGGQTAGLGGSGNGAGGGAAGGPHVAGAEFDHSLVYMWGTLDPNSPSRDVIAQWETPNTYVAGFRNAGTPYLRNNKLLYLGAGVYEFVADGWGNEPLQTFKYEIYPNNNDIRIETLGCPEPQNYVVGPTGTMLHACEEYYLGPLDWYDAQGNKVLVKRFVSALDNGDNVLLSTGEVMGLDDLVIHDRTLPKTYDNIFPLVAVRSAANGGWHAVINTFPRELWQINADGTSSRIGAYAPSPVNGGGAGHPVLTPDDTMFTIEGTFDTQKGYSVYVIIRYKLDGVTELVFNAADGSFVQLYGYSTLFTGP